MSLKPMPTVYVLFSETGVYSDYSMVIEGVYSSYQTALATLDDPEFLGVEYWDGTISNEHQYTANHGPERVYTIQPYVLDTPPDSRETADHDRPESTPLPPTRFTVGQRVRAVRSKRTAVVLAIRESPVANPTWREITLLPDDPGFIGRGATARGKVYVTEDQVEPLP